MTCVELATGFSSSRSVSGAYIWKSLESLNFFILVFSSEQVPLRCRNFFRQSAKRREASPKNPGDKPRSPLFPECFEESDRRAVQEMASYERYRLELAQQECQVRWTRRT